MSTEQTGGPAPATVDQLRLATGFGEHERESILELFRKLDRRLARFTADEVEMELSVKERDTPSQSVVLEAWIARRDRLVATSSERELRAALMDVRDDLLRQIDKSVGRRLDRQRR